ESSASTCGRRLRHRAACHLLRHLRPALLLRFGIGALSSQIPAILHSRVRIPVAVRSPQRLDFVLLFGLGVRTEGHGLVGFRSMLAGFSRACFAFHTLVYPVIGTSAQKQHRSSNEGNGSGAHVRILARDATSPNGGPGTNAKPAWRPA